MSYAAARKALIQEWLTEFPTESDPGVCAYPNRDFTRPAGAAWYRVSFLPIDKVPASLGTTGLDEQTGILQIDLNAPRNKGDGDLYSLADTITSHFRSGRVVATTGVNTVVTRSTASPGRVVDDDFRLSISIYYRTRTNRPPL